MGSGLGRRMGLLSLRIDMTCNFPCPETTKMDGFLRGSCLLKHGSEHKFFHKNHIFSDITRLNSSDPRFICSRSEIYGSVL